MTVAESIATGPSAGEEGAARKRVAVLVMGVCGVGKSLVGAALAHHLGARFLEGDAFHPPANVERMRAGVALTDADRAPWLQRLAGELADAGDAVLACSALKRRYREVLRARVPTLRVIHLHGDPALLRARVATRADHYMPASLLDSQLADLEPPAHDEPHLSLDVAAASADVVRAALAWVRGAPRRGVS